MWKRKVYREGVKISEEISYERRDRTLNKVVVSSSGAH